MKEDAENPCPYDTANWFSRITFWWLTPLFIKGFKRPLTASDLYDVSKEDNSTELEKILERSWKKELRRYSDGHKVSLLGAILRSFRSFWVPAAVLLFISETSKLLSPFMVGMLVAYFEPNSTTTMATAYIYAVVLGSMGLVQMFSNPLYYFILQRSALKMKAGVGSLIYRKVLSLSSQSFYQTTSGQIVNLLSTDVEKFHEAMQSIHYLWLSPIVTILCVYLIFRMCGMASLFGFVIIIVFMPLQMFIGKMFGTLRTKVGHYSDRRIHTMTEILSGVKVIKMYCWEYPFSKAINSLRRTEIKFLTRALSLMSLNMSNASALPRLMTLFIFLGNWMFFTRQLGTAEVFITIGLLEILKVSLFYALPFGIQTFTELRASTERIKTFLLLDEERDLTRGMQHKSVVRKDTMPQFDWSVEIDHMTARWEMTLPDVALRKRKRDSTNDTSKLLYENELEQYFSIKNITLTIKKGEILAIVGSVGSGKSSLLLTLLGELPHQQGQITLLGKVGYSSQEAWIFSGSVRDNILFGGDMEEERYRNILEACALNKDIELMVNGDLTLVGERGLMLSGGQKARLSLARALYKNADIYLLDDPLSAVDAKVGNHIFNKCFLQALAGKTRIIVTHQLQYLQKVDRIAVMREGSLYDVGTFAELTSRGVDIATFLAIKENKQMDEADFNINEEDRLLLSNMADEVKGEESDTGTVNMSVYWEYLKSGYGYILFPLILILVSAERGFLAASEWMLARWTESQQNDDTVFTNTTLSDNTSAFVTTAAPVSKDWAHMPSALQYYVIFVCLFVVGMTVFGLTHIQMCAIASRRLHNRMFRLVLGAKTQFFDSNPVGRILNRFSRDLGFVDNPLARCLFIVIDQGVMMSVATVVVCIVSPWLLIAVFPVGVFVLFIRYFSVQTTRQIRRLEAVSRSPMYSHVSETIRGLQTIRAFRKEDQFIERFDSYQNKHSSAWFLYLASYRWFSLRSLFAVIIFYNIIIHVCLILHESISSGLLAMILINTSAWVEPFEFTMRMSAELENYMTSVQRILAYSKLEQEKPKRSDKPPPPNWPMQGSITFTDVSLRYTEDTPLSLKNINFHIKSKEKIGIVGRTGAGKSSLLSALFRLAEPTGKIWIDGVDVTKIGLHELREKISVIPQDPTLFSGTLRKNLDPFEEYKDEEIWHALDEVQLKKKIESTSEKLYMEVSEFGHNFSVGQRQLICLARAILRYNKILILDEATANVDHRTDALIQMTLRSKFRSCTVLTVAHRLNTVMDCDRIMVLDEGELKEFDIPFNLLQIQDGYFSHLVNQTGQQQAEELRTLAQIAFGQRASASLLLAEAVKTATLHLQGSHDDLSESRESLKSSQELLRQSLEALNSSDKFNSRGIRLRKGDRNRRTQKLRDSCPAESAVPNKTGPSVETETTKQSPLYTEAYRRPETALQQNIRTASPNTEQHLPSDRGSESLVLDEVSPSEPLIKRNADRQTDRETENTDDEHLVMV